MKLGAGVIGILLLASVGCASPQPDQMVLVALGEPRQIAQPILTPAGRVLAGRFGGSEAEIVEIAQGRAVSRARVLVEGIVTNLQLATGGGDVAALAVVTSCPGGFGDQPESEEFRTCVTPLALTSIELDAEGRDRGNRRNLPPGLGEGTVFGSDGFFVWTGWESSNRAIYAGGEWRPIATSEPATSPVVGRCVTEADLWVLHGETGDSDGPVLSGDVAVRSFSLFRYPLDGSVDNPWEPVQIAQLDRSRVAELACGEREAFVRLNDSLYSTGNPGSEVSGIRAGIDELRANASRRPVLFLDDMTCAIVGEGGRLLPGRERQGTATSPTPSSCDAVPWPRGGGFLALSSDLLGNVRMGPW